MLSKVEKQAQYNSKRYTKSLVAWLLQPKAWQMALLVFQLPYLFILCVFFSSFIKQYCVYLRFILYTWNSRVCLQVQQICLDSFQYKDFLQVLTLFIFYETNQIKHTYIIASTMNQEQQAPFISLIEDQWRRASSNLQSKRAEYSKALELNEGLKQQTSAIEFQILGKLKNIRQNFMDKIIQLKQIKQHFDAELAILSEHQSYNPQPLCVFGEQKLKPLQICLQNPLKFDSLSAKIERLRIECENKSNILKDEIKKVKLRMSLCEMEYKELVNPGKRKSD